MSQYNSSPCTHCGTPIDPLELCSCADAQRAYYRRRTTYSDAEIETIIASKAPFRYLSA